MSFSELLQLRKKQEESQRKASEVKQKKAEKESASSVAATKHRRRQLLILHGLSPWRKLIEVSRYDILYLQILFNCDHSQWIDKL